MNSRDRSSRYRANRNVKYIEMNWFIILLLFNVIFGYRHLRFNGVHLIYTFSTKSICHIDEDRFFQHQGLSFENCVKECGLRPHCMELNFNRRTLVCELFSTVGNGEERRGDCVRVFSSDIEVIERPAACDDCAYGETCEIDQNGAGTCLVKECVNSPLLVNGDTKGNMRNVGMTVWHTCDTGYKERNGIINRVCLDTGQWNETAVCVEEGNIAEGKTAYQSSNKDVNSVAQNAVDGNWSPFSSCSATGTLQSEGWWEVDLGKEYAVKSVVVQTRTSIYGTKFRNILVTISSSTNSADYIPCTSYASEAPSGAKVDLDCNEFIRGRYVRIRKEYINGNDILVLCEVAVYLW